MEDNDKSNRVLNKSFCLDGSNEARILRISLNEEEDDNLVFTPKECVYYSGVGELEGEEEDSETLMPSINLITRRSANYSNPSSELNLFDSLEPKMKNTTHFFRKLTNTQCQITSEEEKLLNKKIMTHYVGEQNIDENDNSKNHNILNFSDEDRVNSNYIERDSNLQIRVNNKFTNIYINNKVKEESTLNSVEFKQLLSGEGCNNINDLNFYLKSKIRNSDNFPGNYNILIVGQKNSGKSTFIKNVSERLKKAINKKTMTKNVNSNLEFVYSINNESSKVSTELKATKCFKKCKIKCFKNENGEAKKVYDMNLIDSPGHHNKIKQKDWLQDIIKYINSKNEEYYMHENNPKNENTYSDGRIHLCLYFIKTVTEFDYETMHQLSQVTNLIPIIAKKDEKGTIEQIVGLKTEIISQSLKRNIKFLELDAALNKVCSHGKALELLKGDYKFCPPFVIFCNSGNKEDEIFENCDKLNLFESKCDDFSRLYYIMTCFIPFGCVELTQKKYSIFLAEKEKKKLDSTRETKNLNKDGLLTFGTILCSLGVGYGLCYFSGHARNVNK